VKVAGLFSGIGGFERGLADSGHETVLMCEIWNPARAVLKQHFPEIACEADIRDLKLLPSDVDLLVGGFPCQDLSQAGLTLGIDGKRSGLVAEVFRILDERAVPWVVLENVSFMLHLDGGRALSTLVDAFEQRGYRWAYRVVNSQSFLPQRRERVFFVATTTAEDPANVLFADEAAPKFTPTELDTHAHGFYWTEGIRGLGWAADAIPTLKNGSTVGIPSPPAILLPSGVAITPDIRDAERLQGLPADWTKPAEGVGRASFRWSLIGNAVSVPVAAWLGKRLKKPGRHDPARDRRLPANGRWPRAARFDGGSRSAVDINEFPEFLDRPHLADYLDHAGKPLSTRATRGFLERTERGSLRFVPGFKERLRAHLGRMERDVFANSDFASIAAE